MFIKKGCLPCNIKTTRGYLTPCKSTRCPKGLLSGLKQKNYCFITLCIAKTTINCIRFSTPIFARACNTLRRTARTLILSIVAVSLSDRPSARHLITSTCRGVSRLIYSCNCSGGTVRGFMVVVFYPYHCRRPMGMFQPNKGRKNKPPNLSMQLLTTYHFPFSTSPTPKGRSQISWFYGQYPP